MANEHTSCRCAVQSINSSKDPPITCGGITLGSPLSLFVPSPNCGMVLLGQGPFRFHPDSAGAWLDELSVEEQERSRLLAVALPTDICIDTLVSKSLRST